MNEGDDQEAPWAAPELPEDFTALEARLAALSPRDDRLNRERLMFLAGRASIEGPIGTGDRTRRTWLESKAWPAAFAGMTAIAAALFVALLARPPVNESTVAQAASGVSHATNNSPLVEATWQLNAGILSPTDSRRGDIEALVYSAPHVAVDAALPSRSEQDRATLTPGAWRQIIEASDVLRPNSNDSSDVRILQGVTA